MGVEAHRLLYQSDGLLGPPHKAQSLPQPRIPLSIVGSERDSLLTLSDGPLMLLLPQIVTPQHRVGQGQRVIQDYRPLRQGKCLRQHLRVLTLLPSPLYQIGPAQDGIRSRILWV